MRLTADDFGCVPDGRVLRSVRVQAGAVQLEILDGTVSQGDVGTHIAVPGAEDLVTKIAGLFREKEFPGTMIAGSDLLTATLLANDHFERLAQRGLRITVAGAGPGGATLVTDVVDVPDKNMLQLAQAAATAVNQAPTILNDPDYVILDDHARAPAAAFPVNLGDRTVTVPEIPAGENTLFCPGAAFSSEDLAKLVTIPAAGCFVTTVGAVAEGGSSIVLSSPAQRAVSGGPADIWRTDSRPGFESLLETLSQPDVENADICFSAGVYDFTWVPGGSFPAALKLYGLHNVTLRGAGQDVTVLRLMPGQDLKSADTHILRARNCTSLTLRDLTVRGSYLTLASVGVQAHAILIDPGCADIVIERVGVFQCAGDAVRLLGDTGQEVRRVWLQGCRLVQNNRTGIAFQRFVEFVWVTDCYIETIPPSTQAGIDFEPTPPDTPGEHLIAAADVVIDSNVLVHGVPAVAVSLSGFSAADPAHRIQFTNNVLLGGVMGGADAHDVTISGNTVITGDTALADDTGQVIWLSGSFDGLRVTDNRIIASNGPLAGLTLSRRAEVAAEGVRIIGNDITAAGFGIMLDNPGNQATVDGNRIRGDGQAPGIHIQLGEQDGMVCRDMRVAGNSITGFGDVGIQISNGNTARKIDGLEISSNEISAGDHAVAGLTGIRFGRPDHGTDLWLGLPLVTGNRIADDVTEKIDRGGPTVPFVMLSGNPGEVAVFEGDSSPEGVLSSPPGSLVLSTSGPAGAAAYLKISGLGPTGWVQLAMVP